MEQKLVAAPILCVRSVADTIEFYERCFGFGRPHYFDNNSLYIVLERDDAQIHIIQADRANANNRNSVHAADVFVWVSDLEPICAAAAANGLTSKRGPERYDSRPVATTEVVFEDISGYWVCFAVAHR